MGRDHRWRTSNYSTQKLYDGWMRFRTRYDDDDDDIMVKYFYLIKKRGIQVSTYQCI